MAKIIGTALQSDPLFPIQCEGCLGTARTVARPRTNIDYGGKGERLGTRIWGLWTDERIEILHCMCPCCAHRSVPTNFNHDDYLAFAKAGQVLKYRRVFIFWGSRWCLVGSVHVTFSRHLGKSYTIYCPLLSPKISCRCYRNFEPPHGIRTYTRRMWEIMANVSGAVLVEVILTPMHILRPSILASFVVVWLCRRVRWNAGLSIKRWPGWWNAVKRNAFRGLALCQSEWRRANTRNVSESYAEFLEITTDNRWFNC